MTKSVDKATEEQEAVTVPFLRKFIQGQHRAFVHVQITAVIAMGCLAVVVLSQALPFFAGEQAFIGWIAMAFVALVAAVIVVSLMELDRRGALVRDVISAPLADEGD